MAEHHWVLAPRRGDRVVARSTLVLPATLAVVSAHRRLRGPYTAVGALLRAIVPDALDRSPEVVARHSVEILATTPELREVVPASGETLTSLAVPSERTRFYSRLRTLRITHGLVDFLRDYLHALDEGPHALVVDDLHLADATDREFFAVLVRRISPDVLTVVVTTGIDPLTEPPGPIAVPLAPALMTHCEQIIGGHVHIPDAADLAQAYVDSDGASDDPAELSAYHQLDPRERARLHDARAAVLEGRDEPSLRLGAIPYHAEHGSDPTGAGVRALRYTLDYCMDLGYYHAVVDLGTRGRALVRLEGDLDQWWAFTTKMATALAALGRGEQALPLYDEARARAVAPAIHMQAAYATAMLYTRHFERRDHARARAWANQAIALAGLLPDRTEREFNTVFNRTGLALIEVHRGNLTEALRLVDDSLARLDQELKPGEHALHRSVLRYHRARVYAALGRYTEAIEDYTAVIALDPHYAEYYLDRAAVYHRLGRNEDALADYEQAIRLSPPFPEAYYNRGDVRADLGDVDGAIADFGHVIELDPTNVDAYVNRAGLLADRGDNDAALRDVHRGLDLNPRDPHVLCLSGRLLAEAGRTEQARYALSVAITVDPALPEAWASRGVLEYDTGQLTAAIADLETAASLTNDINIQFNLAVAYHDATRYQDALAAFDKVLAIQDQPEARHYRTQCLQRLGRNEPVPEPALEANLLALEQSGACSSATSPSCARTCAPS